MLPPKLRPPTGLLAGLRRSCFSLVTEPRYRFNTVIMWVIALNTASLACVSSAAENAFVTALVNDATGSQGVWLGTYASVWLGTYQRPGSEEPSDGWDASNSRREDRLEDVQNATFTYMLEVLPFGSPLEGPPEWIRRSGIVTIVD